MSQGEKRTRLILAFLLVAWGFSYILTLWGQTEPKPGFLVTPLCWTFMFHIEAYKAKLKGV